MAAHVRLPPNRPLAALLRSAAIVAVPVATLATPTIHLAHNVETDGDVGATFHLEPDHNPKSGEPATIWFALTREGGEAIALDDCDCTLEIVNTQDETETIDVPALTAINAETYTNIPSAEVVFPSASIYNVTLRGEASESAAESFAAFELSYEVTVRPGTAPEAAADTGETGEAVSGETIGQGEATDEAEEPRALVDTWAWLIGALLLLGLGGVLAVIALLRSVFGRFRTADKSSLMLPNEGQTPSSANLPTPAMATNMGTPDAPKMTTETGPEIATIPDRETETATGTAADQSTGQSAGQAHAADSTCEDSPAPETELLPEADEAIADRTETSADTPKTEIASETSNTVTHTVTEKSVAEESTASPTNNEPSPSIPDSAANATAPDAAVGAIVAPEPAPELVSEAAPDSPDETPTETPTDEGNAEIDAASSGEPSSAAGADVSDGSDRPDRAEADDSTTDTKTDTKTADRPLLFASGAFFFKRRTAKSPTPDAAAADSTDDAASSDPDETATSAIASEAIPAPELGNDPKSDLKPDEDDEIAAIKNWD